MLSERKYSSQPDKRGLLRWPKNDRIWLGNMTESYWPKIDDDSKLQSVEFDWNEGLGS